MTCVVLARHVPEWVGYVHDQHGKVISLAVHVM
jgi:hypothetical protein